MYGNQFWEYYPKEIVDRIPAENPTAPSEELHRLMGAEWKRVRPEESQSMADLINGPDFVYPPRRKSTA